MTWKRLLVALPFAIAAVLTVLITAADRFHLVREHIAGYGFLYFAAWAWLLDHVWFEHIHNRRLEAAIVYTALLWIPAFLVFRLSVVAHSFPGAFERTSLALGRVVR